ncbi:MAG: hypothetical protein ACETWM_02315 [Candidatus Lokiarchaeia archaeon]
MIYNIYILTRDGLCVLHRMYGGLEYDEALVTGFLSAISSFSRDISGEEFDLIVLGDKQFVSIPSENLIFVAYSDNGDKVKNILFKIKEEFTNNYGQIDSWEGDIGVVRDFVPVLDEIVGNSGETGILDFTEVRKFFDNIKKKTSTIQTVDLDFPDFKNFIESLKTRVKSFKDAKEKITEFYQKKIKRK